MRRNRELGQALVAVALGLVVLLGVLGLGIDFGYLRYMKRQMQEAVDAAAIAAAGELDYGDSSNAATKIAAKNGYTVGTNGVTAITVYNPPTDEPAGQGTGHDPHNGDPKYVSVVINQTQPTFFAKAFGVSSVAMSVRAEAKEGGGDNCMYSLDPSASGAMTMTIGSFQANCGLVDESSSGSAFNCFLEIFDAPYIGIHGSDGLSGFLCLFTGASPTNGIHDPTPTDPLAYRQSTMESAAPPHGTCGTTTGSPFTGSPSQLTINTSGVVLNPGTYCGGIIINPGANVTLNPGIYTLTSTSASNGGLKLDPGTTVNGGGGVAFYNYGPHGGIDFTCSSCTLGSVTLTAPTSGPFEGILFFQDPGNTTASQVFGSVSYNTKPTGSYYFPTASLTFAFDAVVDYNDIVAKDITFGISLSTTINTVAYDNYTTLSNGSPIKAGSGVLVE